MASYENLHYSPCPLGSSSVGLINLLSSLAKLIPGTSWLNNYSKHPLIRLRSITLFLKSGKIGSYKLGYLLAI